MFSRQSRYAAVLLSGLCTLVATAAGAQECLGLANDGRGIMTYGLEGTDAAVGTGLGFGLVFEKSATLARLQSLDHVTVVDPLQTYEVQSSLELPIRGASVCLVPGFGRTRYDNSRLESQSWSIEDPGYVTERHVIGGSYRRVRLPLGVGVGREFSFGKAGVIPFLQSAAVYESEKYRPENRPEQTRSGWVPSVTGGLSLTYDWLILRSTLSRTGLEESTLSGEPNWLVISVHAGVRF